MRSAFRHILAFFETTAGRVLRVVLSLLLIAALVRSFDWTAVRAQGGKVEWGPFAAGWMLSLVTYPLCAWRWWLLLRALQIPLTWRAAHAAGWVGQFYNGFLPGGVGGDASRLSRALRFAPEKIAEVTAATLVDRLIGFGTLLTFVPWILSAHPTVLRLVHAPGISMPAVALVGALSLLVLGGVGILVWRLGSQRWLRAFGAAAAGTRVNLAAVAISMSVWLLDFLSAWLLAKSLGLSLPFTVISGALVLAYLSTLLPISLGGHGLRESAMVLGLLVLVPGTTPQDYAAFALLFLAVILSSSLLGGVVFLLEGMRKKNARA